MIAALLCHSNGRIEITGLPRLSPIWRKPIPVKRAFMFAMEPPSPPPTVALIECVEFKLTSNSGAWPIYEEIVREDEA